MKVNLSAVTVLSSALLQIAGVASAATRYVSLNGLHVSPFTNLYGAATNIQTAINVSSQGDEIIVYPGVYTENISVYGDLNLHSLDPCDPSVVSATVITRKNSNALITIASYSDARVAGFTISNSLDAGVTGGSSESIIEWNTIACNSGGGLSHCTGTVQNNSIVGNTGEDGGGLHECTGTVRNNLIADNTASKNGGGIYLSTYGTAQIANNTIARNLASLSGGGIYRVYGQGYLGIFNNILWGNLAGNYAQYYDGAVTPHYCCIQNGTMANNCITSSPKFKSVNDFHISTNSPCVDIGFNLPGVFSQCDLDGGDRVVNGTVDMGCYEYGSTPEPVSTIAIVLWLAVLHRPRR